MGLKSIAMPGRCSTASSNVVCQTFFIKLELANLQKPLNVMKQSSKSRLSPFLLELSMTSKKVLKIFPRSFQKGAKMDLNTYQKASAKKILKKVTKKHPKSVQKVCPEGPPGEPGGHQEGQERRQEHITSQFGPGPPSGHLN